jgi:hypothetical protein
MQGARLGSTRSGRGRGGYKRDRYRGAATGLRALPTLRSLYLVEIRLQFPTLNFDSCCRGQCRVRGNHVAGQELPPEQSASSRCPTCGTEMVITRITPILFGEAFEELSLACKTCDYRKKIKIERS